MRSVLISLIVLLALAAALQWRGWPPAPPPAPASGTLDLPEPPARPSIALDDTRTAEDYLSVAERPLFSPDRRPPSDEPAPVVDADAATAEELAGLDVNAILIQSPTLATVWLVPPAQRNELVKKRRGDDYEGWVITAIEPDRVRFERQGQSETLELNDFNAPPVRRSPPTQRREARRPPARTPRKPAPASQNSGADDDR
ncbi:hypothetical protein [Halochromatium glycolicum]|uniref:hypothetical protein n=1 Tax=Halochromatium glycolicum TaxID=85075 RepID=UPI00190C3010|nr:hypothetical protein [Halochromatium glycolicum]